MEHLKSTLNIHFCQHTDAGIKHENQDTLGAKIPEGQTLLTKGIAMVVADGVSSSASAKQASQMAVVGFLSDYYATPDTWRTQQSAVEVIQSLNRHLYSQSQNSTLQQGHLTTFSALILKGDKGFIFHVGDSRIYRFRKGELQQITRDHAQKIDKNTTYLTRALGADPALEIDIHTCELEAGDYYLLTTDGVHDFLDALAITELLSNTTAPFEDLAKTLLEKALTNKSTDNLSIQVARINTCGAPSSSDAISVLSRLPFPPFLQVGHKLDHLCVKKIIHESERSQVYLVETPTGQPLIMKTPSINYTDDPVYIERFVMESWIGARIHSPHVAKVIEPPVPRSCLYYLTEYVAGQTLSKLIKEHAPMAIPDAIELIEQMIKGVRAFHRKDSLHQDIKPDNIMIGKQGAVIVDFGSCWVAGIHEAGSPFERDKILGTLDYSAPEYRYNGDINQKADQFSLAVILYEMLTLKKPYGPQYAAGTHLKSFQKMGYVSACKHNPLVPFWLDKALEKALNIDTRKRYESLSEWLQDLKRPNPNWLSQRERPLLEKNPLAFWQLVAFIGWALALAAFFSRRW